MDEIAQIYGSSGSALAAQTARLKIIAQNIANANTTGSAPGQAPYQRQVSVFKNEFDRALGVSKVVAKGTRADTTPFPKKYDPSNPAADAQGYVLMPNVNPLVEMSDMTEASQAYQANLNVIDASRTMILKTINLLQ